MTETTAENRCRGVLIGLAAGDQSSSTTEKGGPVFLGESKWPGNC